MPPDRTPRQAVLVGNRERLEVLPLYSRLSAAEQHRVFERRAASSYTRRVVLATNVAETSLTVPGIKYVIDPGAARISRYSRGTKVQRLPIEPISQASADQRKGRSGRTSDGICIRLYSEEDFESRPEFTEEQRSRFAGSSYQSVLNKVDRFLDSTLPAALRQREQWAVRIMDIDDRVAALVKTMQAMGMKSPYLRAVVVARINPVRFTPPTRKKDAAPPMSMAEALTKMAANVRKFDPKSIRPGDLALVAAIAPSAAD